jgi:hypothetical protein
MLCYEFDAAQQSRAGTSSVNSSRPLGWPSVLAALPFGGPPVWPAAAAMLDSVTAVCTAVTALAMLGLQPQRPRLVVSSTPNRRHLQHELR